MNIRSLAEVGACLEEIVIDLLGADSTDPHQKYLHFEMLAIEILDSQFADFPEGVLEEYLQGYLAQKRLELGVDEEDLT
jgi:hypothetical protein